MTLTRRGESVLELDVRGGDSMKSTVRLETTSANGLLTRAEIAQWLIEHVELSVKHGVGKIGPETLIVDLGLDSLELVALIGELEEILGRQLPTNLFAEFKTIAALADHLAGLPRNDEPDTLLPLASVGFEHHPAYLELEEQLTVLDDLGIRNPYFVPIDGVNGARTTADGREYTNYSSYNYVGLSGNPLVARAAIEAIRSMGTSASASRIASGEKVLHRDLEREIAEFLGVSDAIVYLGGHTTNVSTIACLVGPGDVVLHDALAHDSILLGCRLSGARQVPFPHNDWEALESLMSERRHRYRHALVIVEGVYSMDGDIPELPRFIDVKRRHHAWLMVDEAHSLGVIGRTGRGIGEHHSVDPAAVDVWMGTLSKALASCGGYIAGSEALIKLLKYRSRGFVYSAGMPPPNAAAALAALRQLRAEPERVRRLQSRVTRFLHGARARGLDTGASSGGAVVPIMVGSTVLCLQLTHAIAQRGVLAHPMVFPAVAEDAARLRFFITSEHSESQIDETLDVLAEELDSLKRVRPIRTGTAEGATMGEGPA